MVVLVTGGAGFIGSHLVDALLERGDAVRVLDALVPQVHGPGAAWPAWVPSGVDRLLGDVRDPSIWPAALDGVDAVFHLAAEVGVGQSMYEMTRYIGANTLGTAQLLEALVGGRRVERLMVASSMSLYGEGAHRTAAGAIVYPSWRSANDLAAGRWDRFAGHDGSLTPVPTPENAPLHPTSVYAISKRDQEELCLSVGRAYGIPTLALRLFNVYGPRQSLSNPYTGLVSNFVSRLLNGRPPVIFEDGLQARDFTHVSDVVSGMIRAMTCPVSEPEAINLGTGLCTTVLDVARTLIRALGAPLEPWVTGRVRSGDVRCCYADIGRARDRLGYEPSVSLEAGLAGLVPWARESAAEDRTADALAELEQRRLTR